MSIVSLESKDEKNISMSIAQFFAVYGMILSILVDTLNSYKEDSYAAIGRAA